MVLNFLTKVFGSKNERELKQLQPLVDRINELEPEIQAMSDDQLKAQTPKFKERIDQGESLDELLPEAFATVREASLRTLNMRHFDVQLIGGIVLARQDEIIDIATQQPIPAMARNRSEPPARSMQKTPGECVPTPRSYVLPRSRSGLPPTLRRLRVVCQPHSESRTSSSSSHTVFAPWAEVTETAHHAAAATTAAMP